MDCGPLGSSVHGISQARILEWIAVPSSRGSSSPRDRTFISCTGRWILYHCATRGARVSPGSVFLKKGWEGALFFPASHLPVSGSSLCNSLLTVPIGFPGGSVGKESACNGSSAPGWGRFPGGGHGNPLQYSWLGNPMDRGA